MNERVPALVVGGVPGCGKSVLGHALARDGRAALLDLDTLTAPLVAVVVAQLVELGRVAVAQAHDLSHPVVVAATRRARYACLLATAADVLGPGVPVVLVAPFTVERADPSAWAALAQRLASAGGAPLLVWATAPPVVVLERLRRRGLARDAAALADPASYLAGAHDAAPRSPHVVVDTSESLTDGALESVWEAARSTT